MEILYEDSQLLVCGKEAGLAVQSARIGDRDLVSMLKTKLWERNPDQGEPYLGVVHRLDKPVEGLLAFGKTPKAAAGLSAQLTDGRMKKTYTTYALVSKENIPGEGLLEDWLKKDGKLNTSSVAAKGIPGAKKASLRYRAVECMDQGTLKKGEIVCLEIHLFTGRHHQIRVQMANAGLNLLGDRKYGASAMEAVSTKLAGKKLPQGLALCASSLTLVHPGNGEALEFHYPAPLESWKDLLSE